MRTGTASALLVGVVTAVLALGAAKLPAAGVSYTYDDAGRLTGAVYDSGTTVSYTYDNVGNLLTRVVNTGEPTVVNVTAAVPDGTYGQNQVITIEVEFSEEVTVTGTPTLALATGATPALATYGSGSGTTVLTFVYVVAAGDTAADLDATGSDALSTAGGSIRDAQSVDADLTLPVPGSAGSLSVNRALVVDPTAWQFVLDVSNTQTAALVLGMNPDASDGEDPGLDVGAGTPTGGGGYAALRDRSAVVPDLRTDIRAVSGTGVWPLRITAPTTRADVVLSWNPNAIPGDIMSLVEVDAAGAPVAAGINANMAVTDSVTVPGGSTVYFDLHFNQCLFVLRLLPGWNLCALPIEPHNTSVAAILGGHASGDVLLWNTAAAAYETASALHGKQGFWVFYTGPAAGLRLPVVGAPIADATAALTPGWWLLGGTALPPYDALSLPLSVTPAAGVAGSAWIWISDHYGAPGTLENGKGVWLYVNQACEVELAE